MYRKHHFETHCAQIAPCGAAVQRLHFSCIYFSRRTETWERERSNSDRRELIAGALVKSDNCARLIGDTYEVLWNTESWILLILLQYLFFLHLTIFCAFINRCHPRPRASRPASVRSNRKMVGCLSPQSGVPTAYDGAQSATATNSSRALDKSDTCAHVLEIGS